jgi:DNA replication protein DnaC
MSSDELRAYEEERSRARAREAERQYRERVEGFTRKLAEDLGKRYAPDRVTLDNYELYHPEQERVLARLRKIAADIGNFVKEGRGLILWGTVGTGKDHLLAATMYAAAGKGFSCRWTSGHDYYAACRNPSPAEYLDLKNYESAHVLGISDPAAVAGQTTDWSLQQLYRVVDNRNREMQPTWITINAQEVGDIAPAIGDAAWSRLQERAEVLRCMWEDYREWKK